MLDTNVLISAFIFKSAKLNELIRKLSIEHEIIICSYTINEIEQLMENKFHVSYVALDEFLRQFPYTFVYSPTHVEEKLFSIRDENDYIILHTAVIEEVDIFITGDKDFDDVDLERPEIMTPSEFLEKY